MTHFKKILAGTLAVLLVSTAVYALGQRTAINSNSVVYASNKSLPSDADRHDGTLYRFSGSFTPQATGAVTLLSIQGSATKTVRVKRIFLTGHSTANAQEILALQRTSALGAGGTTVNPTAAVHDTSTQSGNTLISSPAATAVVAHYTTTLKAAGTGVGGPLSTQDFWTGVVTTPTVGLNGVTIFPEGDQLNKGIVLRGTADFLELQNANAGNLSAGTVLQYTIELEEDNS